MWLNPHFPADLVTFIEEILNGKLHFLCNFSHISSILYHDFVSPKVFLVAFNRYLFFQKVPYTPLTKLTAVYEYIKKQPMEVSFLKKTIFKIFAKFTRKNRCPSLFFSKVAGQTPFSQSTSGQLLLYFQNRHVYKNEIFLKRLKIVNR